MSMELGRRLAAARREFGLSQAQLGVRAGTSQATISAYENGHKEPGVQTLQRLLAACAAQLDVVPREGPVVKPSHDEYARRGRDLSLTLGLAGALPSRHDHELPYPPLRHLGR